MTALNVDYSETDRTVHRLLQTFTELRRQRAAAGSRRFAVDIATLLLKKRLFSSPIAFAKTIDYYAETLHRRSLAGERSTAEPAAAPAWLEQLELAGEDEADDELKSEAERDQLARAAEFQAVLIEAEDNGLAEMVAWGRQHGDRPDAKARRLLELLAEVCRPDGTWNQERIVVFTEYRDAPFRRACLYTSPFSGFKLVKNSSWRKITPSYSSGDDVFGRALRYLQST